MRIAVFSDNFYPELSGISDSIVLVCRDLARRGHAVHLYVPRYAGRNYRFLNLSRDDPVPSEMIAVTRLVSLPFKTTSGQGRAVIPTGTRLPRVRKFAPQIIHTHLPYGAGIEALLASRRLRVPLIGTNHTPIAEFLKDMPLGGRRLQDLGRKYYAWYYSRCAFVSSPARSVLEEMKQYGFHAPHRMISNPVNLGIFHPRGVRPELKRKFGLADFTLAYAGRLAPEKNIDVAVRAVARILPEVPGTTLAVIGKGPAEKDLRKLAGSLGVEKAVKFLGFLPSVESLAQVYNASDVFVMTSTAESQSLAVMQAMACGLPVVGVRAWGLSEYIHPDNGVLIDPGDSETLARELLVLWRHPERREALGRSGRSLAGEISTERIAGIWEDVYRDLAGRSQAVSGKRSDM